MCTTLVGQNTEEETRFPSHFRVCLPDSASQSFGSVTHKYEHTTRDSEIHCIDWGKTQKRNWRDVKLNSAEVLVSGAVAGALSKFVVMPFDTVRKRLQVCALT